MGYQKHNWEINVWQSRIETEYYSVKFDMLYIVLSWASIKGGAHFIDMSDRDPPLAEGQHYSTSNSLMSKFGDVQIRWCPNSVMSKFGDVQIRWCPNSVMSKFGDVQIRWCPNSVLSKFGDVQIRWCPNSVMSKYGDVQIRWCPNMVMSQNMWQNNIWFLSMQDCHMCIFERK